MQACTLPWANRLESIHANTHLLLVIRQKDFLPKSRRGRRRDQNFSRVEPEAVHHKQRVEWTWWRCQSCRHHNTTGSLPHVHAHKRMVITLTCQNDGRTRKREEEEKTCPVARSDDTARDRMREERDRPRIVGCTAMTTEVYKSTTVPHTHSQAATQTSHRD